MKIPIEGHKIKWPNLERNVQIALWAGLSILITVLLILAIRHYEVRERAQDRSELKAIQQKHAISVTP